MSIMSSYNILLKRVAPHPLIDPRATYKVPAPPKENPQETQLPLVIHDTLMLHCMMQQNPYGNKLHPH